KRDIGDPHYSRLIDGKKFAPEAISALILKKLKQGAETVLGPVHGAVVTVPAYFDERRRQATITAGIIAGLDVIDIINEPTAAAIAFAYQRGLLEQTLQRPERILIYDLGGGTFDVTITEVKDGECRTVATDGDVQLGGRDWDQRLIDHVAQKFIHDFGRDPRQDANTAGRLWRECEDAKHTLSARSKASIACDFGGQAMRVEVARAEFEQMTGDLLDRTNFTTRQTLLAAGLSWDDIDRVLLVGGSTRMPAVVEMLRRLSGKEPDRSVSPDEAVAHGAAIHAGMLLDRYEGRPPRLKVRNVNSHSLGVVATDTATGRKQNAILIPRNTALPASAKRVFQTHHANQGSIRVEVVEGESLRPESCSAVGKCGVRDLPENLPAHTPIEVRFRYEENGRLAVQVKVAGEERAHEFARANSLSSEQLDQWRLHVSGKQADRQPSEV
ncbi:MAG: Hsp70 family protein, partial [Pirellulaceae bacterium]|nr:Hsp70 family protein [Pirellulaceae bacterium]